MTRRLLLVVAAVALAAAGCASVGPLQPLSGGTARQAWQELEGSVSAVGTFRTYASVRISTPEGKRSFRATLEVDSDGRVRMSAFTPVGTEVFGFDVSEGVMVFANHSTKTSWTGPFSDVAAQLGIPASLDATAFARLAFGLPAGRDAADLSAIGSGIVRQDDLVYKVSGLGLESVEADGTAWRVRYEPVTFPAEKVTFEDSSERSITVRHLDLSHVPGRSEPLVVDRSYTCCVKPAIGK